MSDDSISYGEDKENLLYISKKINVDDFGLGEEELFSEASSSEESVGFIKPIGSEIKILEDVHDIPQILDDPQLARRFKPFQLRWSFGMNVNAGIINLTSDSRKEIFFSSVHSGIVYNYCTREMRHMEGHQALINCISTDNNGDWLVSSDSDPNGCLIVWCSKDLSPVCTLFNLYPESGILLTAISPCARYLVTIGEESFDYYGINFLLWTLGEDKPNDVLMVNKSHGVPIKICFNPDVEEHFMLVFQREVFLIVWDPVKKKLLPPVIPQIADKNKIGNLTCGTYMKQCHECYVSSTKGCVLTFRNTLYGRTFEDGELSNAKMYINAVKVAPGAIDLITTTEGILVVGDSRGHILFFDRMIRILYWIRNVSVGSIKDLSFALSPKRYHYENSKIFVRERQIKADDDTLSCDYQDMEEEITNLIEAPFDASLDNKPFVVRDFFLCTADCNIYAFNFINNACTSLFQIADANISCIDAHDEMPYIVIGYENGRVSLIDFERKEQIATHVLPKAEEATSDVITCIKYSKQSIHLICGRQNGEVWILEPVILTPKNPTPFRYSHSQIVKVEFSGNSLQFAYFDKKMTVLLFNYNSEKNCWYLRGKVRPHYEQINDIRFFSVPESNTSILHTIGSDRYLVEYNNLDVRTENDELFGIKLRERIEQSAIPMNFTYYEREVGSKLVGYLLLADDKHKIKMLHALTKVPRTLSLGPSFGCFADSHIKKMRVLAQHHGRYMIFSSDRHIGINILPPDGNPYKCTGYLAHPEEVVDFAISHNGLYVFTYGSEDRCVLQWEIKPRSVELLNIMGGTELEPYYCLLEGGKRGWLFYEIQDLFFYMQILQQENIDLPRRVSDFVNLSEIPDLVRTCGYYPSHFELETLMLDIRYRDFDETGVVKDEISFVDFVKLFLNHRPAYGYVLSSIKDKFNTVCTMTDYPRRGKIDSNEFIYLLQTIGEPSPNLHKNLTTLLRITDSSENNYDFLPEMISTNFFFYEMLGIDPDRTDQLGTEPIKDDEEAFMPFHRS